MKAHTTDFKNEIKRFGRQISSKIFHYYTFSLITEDDNFLITENDFNLVTEQFNENDKELIEEENINQITIIQDGQLLKSLMKRVELETTIDIDIKDVIRVNFGVLVNGNYEYLDYGNYIVYKKTYNANNKSWNYICYDMMLYSMIEYRRLNISYPITITKYLKAIADKMGINFASENDEFTNYNQLITKDYFQNKNMTLRDILDLLSQITASVICINNNNELEIRYPSNAGTYETVEGTNLSLENVDDVEDFNLELQGDTVQDGTPTPDSPVEIQTVSGRQEITINQNSYEINLSNIELCKIGDYKDKIYKQDGKWYLEKNIGKVMFNGTENWADRPNYTYADRFVLSDGVPNQKTNNFNGYSNYFNVANQGTIPDTYPYIRPNNTQATCNFSAKGTTTLAQFKTWLSTHNTIIYYILATPTTTEITDTELINQLEAIKLLQGINNVTVDSSDLPSPLELTYLKYYETIDEEMLKNVNVNFGEKFGPINKVTLIDSENKIEYTSQDDISIEKNNLIEIKINDNPITLNGDIETICNNILKRLSGIYYSINDFKSTGICYFDYLDVFKVKIEGNDYKCLLLNDEIEITQGLQETIYSESLENSNTETDNYKTNILSNKEVQQKIVKLDDNKVDNKSVVSSINNSKETTVVDTNKILNRKTINGITDSNGFLDTQLNNKYIIFSATAQFLNNDYGFIIPYYYYNNGNPKWLLKIENKNKISLINTEITVIIYYAMIKEEYEWQI